MNENFINHSVSKIFQSTLPISTPEFCSSLTLAYIGDAVFELYIRLILIKYYKKVEVLHKKTVAYVMAKTQAKFISILLPLLKEEEVKIYKRARNSKVNVPKSSSIAEYKKATGFEALIGYLYLKGSNERIDEILSFLPILENKNEKTN